MLRFSSYFVMLLMPPTLMPRYYVAAPPRDADAAASFFAVEKILYMSAISRSCYNIA